MAGVLKYLNVELRLATKDFNNNIKAAQREAKEFEKTVKPMQDVLKSVGVAASAAGLAIVGSFVAMTKASANYGDALNDASKRTGATVEELARLKFAAEQSGASFEDVSTGMRFLAINSNKAAEGSKAQATAFNELGIKVTDAHGKVRPMNELLLLIADRFQGMHDGAEKSALAVELFGRGGTALIPTLNEGSAGLKKMGDEAQRLGLVISKDTAEASDKFNDSMESLKGSMLGLSNAVAEALLPSFTRAVELMTDGIVKVRNFAKEHEFLTKAIFAAGVALAGAGGLALGARAAISALSSLNLIIKAVTLSLGTMQAAISAASLLTAVRSYGDLSAAISLIGGTSLVAKAGLIGLAGAVGYLIGSFINAEIKARGFEDELDSLLQTTLRVIGPVGTLIEKISGISAAKKAATAATENLSQSQKRLVEDLNKRNIAVDESRLNDDKYLGSLGKLLTAQQKQSGELDKAVAAYKSAHKEVKAGTGLLNDYTDSTKKAKNAYKEWVAEMDKAGTDYAASMGRMKQAGFDFYRELDESRKDDVKAAEAANDKIAADTIDTFGRIQRARQQMSDLVRMTEEANAMEASRANTEAYDQIQLEVGAAIDLEKRHAVESKNAAETFRQAWATAVGNIASRFSDTIADMIVDWDFGWKGMLDILKDTAKSMLSAFISGFITPMLSQAAGLGGKLAESIFGSGKGGGVSIPGVGGGGGSAGGGAGGGQPGGLAGTLGMAGSIGNVLGGVDTVAGWINSIGAGRQAADEIVKSQNAMWAAIVALHEGRDTGSAKSLARTRASIDEVFADWQESVKAFAGSDPNNQKVANQAFATLIPTITQLRSDLDREIDAAGGAPGEVGAVTIQQQINVNFYVQDMGDLTAMDVREKVMPEITTALELGIRGFREKWTQIFRDSLEGVASTSVG